MLPVVAGPALGGWLSLKADCHCISVGSKKIMKFIITKLVPLIEIDLNGAKSPLQLIQSVAGWEQWSVSHTKTYRCLIQSLHCRIVTNFSRRNLSRHVIGSMSMHVASRAKPSCHVHARGAYNGINVCVRSP